MFQSMRVWFRLVAERTLELDGILATVCPSVPMLSVFNSVVYEDPGTVPGAIPELERAYDQAGVAWTVWVPERDVEVRVALEGAGNVLDAWPEAMAAPLSEIDLEAGAEGHDWERSRDVAAMCSVLEEAFHWPSGVTPPRFTWLPERGHLYLARAGGELAACTVAFDHDGDCAIWNVGTRAAARRRGLATGLMRQALRDARERGCETTSLQATQAGRPVYRRLGYREMGRIEMWERRRS